MKPLVVTLGEPAGIGPDVVLLAAEKRTLGNSPYWVVADRNLLEARAKQLNLGVSFHAFEGALPANPNPGHIWVEHVPMPTPILVGQPSPSNASYVLKTLEIATNHCLKKHAQGLVTGPIHKGVICEAGYSFRGHTEFLQHQSDVPMTQMLFVHPQLKVALLTTHVPLKEVSDHLQADSLKAHIRCLAKGLTQYWGYPSPRIGVLGLNPHAGENGTLGTEEQRCIIPVIHALKNEGLNLSGPLSGDTAFSPGIRTQFDALLAMYHDQALAPLKALGFGEAVNMTLGLPFLRTSVDHGTAFHLAGTGLADPSSFVAAFQLARQLSTHWEPA